MSPYKDVVAFAHWEPIDMIQNIINLEQILIRDPGAMNKKISFVLCFVQFKKSEH